MSAITDKAIDAALQAWFKGMPPMEEIAALGGYLGTTTEEHRADMRAVLTAALPHIPAS